MEKIYVDSLFLLSLLTDYLLCLVSARICSLYLRRRRYFAAALLGAAYSVAVFLPGCGFLSSAVVKLAVGLAMGVIAFGGEDRPLRCTGVFFAVCLSFGGALYAMGLSLGAMELWLLPLCFCACYGGLSLLARLRPRPHERRLAQVELRFLGAGCRFTALVDSGNCLTDPLTGAGVMVVSPHALAEVFGKHAALLDIPDAVTLLEAAETRPELRGRFRLISYRALGGGGLLPLFRPEGLLIDGEPRTDMLAALSAQAAGDGFQAVVYI